MTTTKATNKCSWIMKKYYQDRFYVGNKIIDLFTNSYDFDFWIYAARGGM